MIELSAVGVGHVYHRIPGQVGSGFPLTGGGVRLLRGVPERRLLGLRARDLEAARRRRQRRHVRAGRAAR